MTVSRRCDQVTRTPEGTLLRCAATIAPPLATALMRASRAVPPNCGACDGGSLQCSVLTYAEVTIRQTKLTPFRMAAVIPSDHVLPP